jgi:hypothetical protein
MPIDPENLRGWGNDFISNFINQAVSGMPDRPKLVIAILSRTVPRRGRPSDDIDIFTLKSFSPRPVRVETVEALPRLPAGQAFRVAYLSFDAADSAALFRSLVESARLKFPEMIVYVDGQPVFRSDRINGASL